MDPITHQHHHRLKILFFSGLAAGMSLFIVLGMKTYEPRTNRVAAMPAAVENAPTPTPVVEAITIPTVIVPTLPLITPTSQPPRRLTEEELRTSSSQNSSDGTKLVLVKSTEKNGKKEYEILSSDASGDNAISMLKKTVEKNTIITVPYNTWTPDNKYFFLIEQSDNTKSVFVFEASATPFGETDKYLDVTALFKASGNQNVLDNTTGWASETLLISYTKTPEGNSGPTYWFEVPSRAFIQLAPNFYE